MTAIVVDIFFLLIIFLAPLTYLVPAYATAPALMYMGLLMLGNVRHLNFDDSIDTMAGLSCAVFIVFTANIVTGIMLGFATLLIARLIAGEWRKLKPGVIIISVTLIFFYLGGWAI